MTPHSGERPVRVAVWGLGRHAVNRIIPALLTAEVAELYGVCSRDPRAVSGAATAADCAGWTDPSVMLRDPAVEVVFVAGPTGLHFEHGMAVLNAGKHLWCEKPLATCLEDVEALLVRSRELDIAVYEGLMYLYHPQFRKLREMVHDGKFGTIRSIRSSFGVPAAERPSFRSEPALGGGAFLDLGCYPSSIVAALFPDGEIDVNYASIATLPGSPVDTHGSAVLSIPGGAAAHVEWRTHASYHNEVQIWGDRASVFADRIFSMSAAKVPEFLFHDTHGEATREVGEPGDPFVFMVDAFCQMLNDGRATEAERVDILRRARLSSRIENRAART